MEKILDKINKINRERNLEIKSKKVEIKNCYLCDEKITCSYLNFDLFIDGSETYICEKCINDEECKKFCYCHNCCNDIESYSKSFYCSKCPGEINILCQKCHKLHNILIKITH